MLGALIGDCTGSYYEDQYLGDNDLRNKPKYKDVQIMKGNITDDSILTIAIADALLQCHNNYDNLEQIAATSLKKYARLYPYAGYGGLFRQWVATDSTKGYNSFGNGAAMRISAVAYFASTLEQCKELCYKVTNITHNHKEALKGAECVACCIWLLLHKHSKQEVLDYVSNNYYNLNLDYDKLVKNYHFDVSCQGTVNVALYIFSISNSFEDAIRKSITILGDADTLTCIVGSIAEACYDIPSKWKKDIINKLSPELVRVVKKVKESR